MSRPTRRSRPSLAACCLAALGASVSAQSQLSTAAPSSASMNATSSSMSMSSMSGNASESSMTPTSSATAMYSRATSPSLLSGSAKGVDTVTVQGQVPAYPVSYQQELNATIEAVWSTGEARGVAKQGLSTLLNVDSSTDYGVVLRFNETTANQNYTSTIIPWIAYISCDSAYQDYTLPAYEYTGSTTSSSSSSGGDQTVSVDVLQQAQSLGAKAIVLYSTKQSSCHLNDTALYGNSSDGISASDLTVPIFTTATQQTAQIILNQFDNVEQKRVFYNSTLLFDSIGNLTSALSAATGGNVANAIDSIITYYVVARITPSYDKGELGNGVVATIAHAPSSTGRTAATGSAAQNSSGNTSGAERSSRRRSMATLAALGFSAGALLAGVGLLL
ncbi:hypothetical protein JCM8202v2_004683 [Rhodotorula sphaerocarpa]